MLQTYVNNINAQVEKFGDLKQLDLVGLLEAAGTDKVPAGAATAVR